MGIKNSLSWIWLESLTLNTLSIIFVNSLIIWMICSIDDSVHQVSQLIYCPFITANWIVSYIHLESYFFNNLVESSLWSFPLVLIKSLILYIFRSIVFMLQNKWLRNLMSACDRSYTSTMSMIYALIVILYSFSIRFIISKPIFSLCQISTLFNLILFIYICNRNYLSQTEFILNIIWSFNTCSSIFIL